MFMLLQPALPRPCPSYVYMYHITSHSHLSAQAQDAMSFHPRDCSLLPSSRRPCGLYRGLASVSILPDQVPRAIRSSLAWELG